MEFNKENRPKVGIGVMVIKGGKVLLGKRKGSHGEGEYAWLGGHMEHMESFEECAQREVFEETGMKIGNIKFLRLFNLKSYPPKHYVDLAFVAQWISGEAKVMEPEKCEEWDWYDMDNLPGPRFATVDSFIESYKTGRDYWDA